MRAVFSWALALAALAGCSGGAASSPDGGAAGGELVYLVHNELWRIGLDGSGAARIATVGDDPHRTGFPRRLTDGRIALLADDTGAIRPYVYDEGGARTVGDAFVTLFDAIGAATVDGQAAIVYTVTPFSGARSELMRADPAAGDALPITVEREGLVSEPAPWDDGAVLVVRQARGQVTLEIVDVAGGAARELLATVDAPYLAHAPARLPDGRVLFVRTDPRDSTDTAIGELFVLDRGGVARTTGITGVRALVVAGGAIVYEVGGADGVTDLVRTNLVDPPVNLTRTPTVSEHLGWSD